MIMAGRGRRLTGEQQESTKPGELSSAVISSNLSSLVTSINEINVTRVNASLVSRIQSCVTEIFSNREAMRNALSDLHNRALGDAEFGEKLVLALEQVSNFEVDGALLRNELLSFIQDDFKIKDTVFQSDRKKFINSVLLLGGIYNRIKVCGEPIIILGTALLEYFDVLIKGEEGELKALTKLIFINGQNLSEINRYELLVYDLRKILINENLSSRCKCWILLAIDIISNGWKPLKGIIRNFYVANLGEEYKNLELLLPNDKSNQLTSPKSIKNEEITSGKKKNETSPNKIENFSRDLSKNFSDINLKLDKGNNEKVQLPSGKSSKKDFWKSSGGGKKSSGHDDRFEREENFYGIQKPRQSKPENQRKNISGAKINKKGSNISKTGIDDMTEPQLLSGSESLGL